LELEMYHFISYDWSHWNSRLPKSLRINLEAIPGKYSIHSLQKTSILGTSGIIRKYCSVKLEA
jgi:hypothetical protein